MGNELSQEEQEQILEEAYNEENVDNNGQTKPKSTREGSNADDEGKIPNNTHKHRRASSSLSEREDQEERRKRQHKEQQQQQMQQELSAEQKKLSYFQMARLGYQELVNAIIRPPRADYKVSG